MAETLKSWASVELTTSLADLLTMGGSESAVVNVTFCNRTASAKTVRFSHAFGGAADAVSQYKLYDVTIAANDTLVWPAPINMGNNDKLRGLASANSAVSVTLDGVLRT